MSDFVGPLGALGPTGREPNRPDMRAYGASGYLPVTQTRADRVNVGDTVFYRTRKWTVIAAHAQGREVRLHLEGLSGDKRNWTVARGFPVPVLVAS